MSVHNAQHLLPDVLTSLQTPGLHKVLKTPGTGELAVLPCVVDSQESEVVALGLVELGLPLVCNGLFVLHGEGEEEGEEGERKG